MILSQIQLLGNNLLRSERGAQISNHFSLLNFIRGNLETFNLQQNNQETVCLMEGPFILGRQEDAIHIMEAPHPRKLLPEWLDRLSYVELTHGGAMSHPLGQHHPFKSLIRLFMMNGRKSESKSPSVRHMEGDGEKQSLMPL